MSSLDGVCFTAPAPLLSGLSDALKALVQTSTESDAPVVLEVDDKDTFRCFFQFVYTGSYTGLTLSAETSATTESQAGASCGGSSYPSNPHNFKFPYSLVSYKIAADQQRSYKAPSSSLFGGGKVPDSPRHTATTSLISSFLSNHNYRISYQGDNVNKLEAIRQAESVLKLHAIGDTFIGHVKVWCFAKKYGIIALMESAHKQLAISLAEWVIFDSIFVQEFGKLARFVYSEEIGNCSKLQQLVAQFAACVFDDVWILDGWVELLREVQNFAVDTVAASRSAMR